MSIASNLIKNLRESIPNDQILAKEHDLIDWNTMEGIEVKLKDGRKFLIGKVLGKNPDGSSKIQGRILRTEVISSKDIGGYGPEEM